QLLKPETVELIWEEQANGIDLVLPAPMRWGVGYGLAPNVALPYVPDEKICFWGGWGGSMGGMWPDRRTTITYAMNKMGPGILGSDRMATYGTLTFDALTSGRTAEVSYRSQAATQNNGSPRDQRLRQLQEAPR